MRFLALLFACSALAGVNAGESEQIEFKGAHFTVFRLDPTKETLELFWRDSNGQPYRTFEDLSAALAKQNRKLTFAMNAGIYLDQNIPQGLHIEKGRTLRPLDQSPAPDVSPIPNFLLTPNGVFFVRPDSTAAILETGSFARSDEAPRLATQSGPLLVQDGKIHPAFNEPSTSAKRRNGVGVDSQDRIVFVCSERSKEKNGAINFYRFAQLFRDELDCQNALYLDGVISRVFVEGHGPVPRTIGFAGILALTESKK